MSVELDPLTIVNQMRDLAAEPRHRRAMVEDQVLLFGLVYFLDYPNPQAVYSALLAVRYLAECRANRETMKGELGMMLNLQNVMQKSTSPEETKLLASEIYEILQLAGKEEAEQAEAAAASCQRKAQFFLGSNNKRAKTVVLHIEGLDDPALGTAINSTKVMIAQQEVKTEVGGEMILPFQEGSAVLVEENIDIPDYLPEEESPSQEQDKAVTDDMGWLCTAANFLTSFFYW